MRKALLYICLLFAVMDVKAQSLYAVSGQVIDETGKAIAGATVFITNSKSITSTNSQGRFSFDNIKPGAYEVVVKFIGFNAGIKNLIVRDKPATLNFILQESNTMLRQVVIRPDGSKRDKYMAMFIKNFIGKTPNASQCKILNPDAISFSYNKQTDVLTATADELLVIENMALGYKIKYLVREFRVFVSSYTCVNSGSPYFEELVGTLAQQKKWEENRRVAYLGSARHFFRAIMNCSAKQEGFICYQVPENITQEEFAKIPYADTDTLFTQTGANLMSLISKPWVIAGDTSRLGIYIIYVGPKTATQYYKRSTIAFNFTNRPASIIQPMVDTIVIDRNGGLAPSKSFITTGYWATTRMANLVPMEYSLDVMAEIEAGKKDE
jgi:hypothetical protein